MRPYKLAENSNFTWMSYNVASHSFTGTGFTAYYDGYSGTTSSFYFTTSGGLVRSSIAYKTISGTQTYYSTTWISLS